MKVILTLDDIIAIIGIVVCIIIIIGVIVYDFILNILEKIRQQQIEIIDLKEQIYMLEEEVI